MRAEIGRDGYAEAYSYTSGGKTTLLRQDTLPVASVLHIGLFHPLDDHYGLAPLEAAQQSLDLHNAAAVCAQGRVHGVYRKNLLPNYAVFDEQRYFTPGDGPGALFVVNGVKVGVSICEDAWSPTGPIAAQAVGNEDNQLSQLRLVVLNVHAADGSQGLSRRRSATSDQRVAGITVMAAAATSVMGPHCWPFGVSRPVLCVATITP